MVRVDTIDEIREKREIEKARPAEKFSALDYTKAIASTLALDGGSIGSLLKDGRIGWLKYTQNMSAADLAKVIATLVIFSAAGNLKPTKSGAISFAKTKGNPITKSFKEKVEKAVEKYNEQPRGKQLEGLQKIRQSSVDALTSLLRDTKNKADIQTIKGELAEAAKKLNETKENVKAEAKRNSDEAAQVERVKEQVRQEKQKTPFEKKLDERVAEYIRKKKDYDAKVEQIKKNNPNAFKTKVSAKTKAERKAEEMVDLFRDPKEVAKEQAEIARLKEEGQALDLEKGRIDAEREAKAQDKEIDEDPTFDDEKGTPDASIEKKLQDETIKRQKAEKKEAEKKSEKEDKPDFGDESTENEPLLDKAEGKEQTETEMIDSAIKEAEDTKAASSTVSKAATAATAAAIGTEVVNKLTNDDDEEPPVISMDFVEEGGFTTETVKEGEAGTQSTDQPTPAPTPAPSPATASISFTNHKEKRTQNTENIDELFSITIKVCTDVYDNKIGEERNYYYYGDFDIPILFFVSQKILYIGFRGTDNVSNILTDLTTSDLKPFKNNTNSNFLNRHEPFNKILDSVASNIEFSLGIILSLKKSYPFIIDRIKDIDHSINSIVVTGHSLGGAMAQLFTYVYNNSNQDKYNKIPIKHLVTYGQPRSLFDKPEYIKLFNNSVKGYHRVWNTQDPIVYLPFKKKVTVENMLGSEIMSGYTHVGDSFDLSGNIVNNDVNLLLYEILKGNKEKIEMVLESKDLLTNSKLLKFMLSDKYLSLQLYTFYKCLDQVEVKEEITQEQITFLTRELQKDTSNLLSYAEKCDLVKPWGISEILKMNPIGDDLDEENFSIVCMAGSSLASCKVSGNAHRLKHYHMLLDKLIARQIDEKKPIFEVIDKVNFYERKTNLFDGVIGMVEGDFENGSVVTF